MNEHPLDNPLWHALATRHREHAIGGPLARRYDPQFTPFAAVQEVTCESTQALRDLVASGERVGILNVVPEFGSDWNVEKELNLLQMVWEGESEPVGDAVVTLGVSDIPEMLALTSLVYPAYFRARTAELGEYLGIFDGDRLCAMAGIRMALPGFQEISAVCTHPDYRGRGYAKRLMRGLICKIAANGNQPFLHTEDDNQAGFAVYSSLGFRTRRELPFWVLTRV